MPGNDDKDSAFDPEVRTKQEYPGFEKVIDSRVVVRPEAIKSVFYMYRIIGEKRYQNVAWEMWQGV
jgi:mannosyl-oligosaccharide alpha-1,2-mannosidase